MCAIHGVSQQLAHSTGARAFRADELRAITRRAHMRQSRPSFPVRLWSARESDLRASSPPCDGHYVVELRIGASSVVPLGLHRSSPSLLRRELLVARPSTLPSACSHHTGTHDKRARGPRCKRPLVHKKLSFSTQFPKIPHNPQGQLLLTALCATIAAFAIVVPVVEVANGTWMVADGSTELMLRVR